VEHLSGLRWDRAGPLTVIDADLAPALAELPEDPVGLCRAAQGLVMLPHLAPAFDIPDDRQAERSIRPTSAVMRRLLDLDPAPFDQTRAPDMRVIGTCRQFAPPSLDIHSPCRCEPKATRSESSGWTANRSVPTLNDWLPATNQ